MAKPRHIRPVLWLGLARCPNVRDGSIEELVSAAAHQVHGRATTALERIALCHG